MKKMLIRVSGYKLMYTVSRLRTPNDGQCHLCKAAGICCECDACAAIGVGTDRKWTVTVHVIPGHCLSTDLVGIKQGDIPKCRSFSVQVAGHTSAATSLTSIRLFSKADDVIIKQVTQLLQRDRAAGCISFGQKWKTGTGRQCFTDIIGLIFNHCDIMACKAIRFGEKNAK